MLLDHDGQNWADHHTAWSDTAADIVQAVRNTFAVLTDIQFSAPWKDSAQPSAADSSAASIVDQPSGSAASRS